MYKYKYKCKYIYICIYIYSSETNTMTFQNDMILYKSGEQLLIFIKQQSIIEKKGEITVV